VWDGLRPDAITPELTPRLARLRDRDGVDFRDQHATYPSVTMMNAAAIATGAYPATHGFYGNTVFWPGPAGAGAEGQTLEFHRPVFTEDYGVLRALDEHSRANGSALLRVETLFEAAHAAGLKTAAIGKSGPAFIQDYRQDEALGVVLDENMAFPLSFARGLQASGFSLPKSASRYPYPGSGITLAANNGDPTAITASASVTLADRATSDPRADRGSPHNARNEYLMRVFLEYVLPIHAPVLSVVWLRNPDSTEHTFGPGGLPVVSALQNQDKLLGGMLDSLEAAGSSSSTDIVVMSDHGHSTVAGDPSLFPLRGLSGAPDGKSRLAGVDPSGFSVSGAIRSADLLTRAGMKDVFDGVSCVLDPGLAGTKANGAALYPTRVDHRGKICDKPEQQYSTPGYRAPDPLPSDAIMVAPNGGSEYFYLPSHDAARMRELVLRLEERVVYGALFVSDRYGPVAGTMPLSRLRLEGPGRGSPPTPDLVASFDWDDAAKTGAALSVPGTEYASALNFRGMHGSASPRDIHSTLIAAGPDFKKGFFDEYPSGTVDVAPTVAMLLGLTLPHADGRVLDEALAGSDARYVVTPAVAQSSAASVARFCRADDPDCRRPAKGGVYRFELREKVLNSPDSTHKYVYLDSAKATRSRN
jgi:predicted AlkP superfamily pyrophosphatase or phosphodiesterase